MDINTYALLLKRIKAMQGGGATPEQIRAAVEEYLKAHPISETDPTVPAWAKELTKPTYTCQEIGALPADTVIPSLLADLGEDVNHRHVSDLEKQTWNNKSDFSGDYNDLLNKPTLSTNLSDMTDDANHRLVSDIEKEAWNNKASKELSTDTTDGLMSKMDKQKLNTVAENANNYVHPDDTNTRHITDAERLKWDSYEQAIVEIRGGLGSLVEKDQGAAQANKVLETDETGKIILKNKTPLPTTLPNPHKLVFKGGVTAEYDGSGAVEVTIPEGGGGSATQRIEKARSETTPQLLENILYVFPEMSVLNYSLKPPVNTNIVNEYHFIFRSGVSATQVVHPVGVKIGDLTIEPNKIYEISIIENLLTSKCWGV